MGGDVGRLAAYSAHRVAVVAVVEEDAGILLEGFQLFRCAGALAIVVHSFAYSEVLTLTADDSTECYCCKDYSGSASRLT